MSGLGQMMTGGAGATSRARPDDDFYATPGPVTEALLASPWRPAKTARVWEPACGDGAIVSVLRRHGYDVAASDLNDHGAPAEHGARIGVDFIGAPNDGGFHAVVTNPPFNVAEQFIKHAVVTLWLPYVAMYLKPTYWQAVSRWRLFHARRPAAVLALTWRPDFQGRGAPTMDGIWCVWRGTQTCTQYDLLAKPGGGLFGGPGETEDAANTSVVAE